VAAEDSAANRGLAEGGLTLVNEGGAEMIPAVTSAVREAATCYGLSPDAADELREACEALLRRVSETPDDPDGGQFKVTVGHAPGRVVVQIDDHGEPYELADDAPSDPQAAIHEPSQLLDFMHERVDRIDYLYRGREGNRIELTKRIAGDDAGREEPVHPQDIDPDQPVEVRPMVEADAIPFVRNVYRSFGYTYSGEWAYHAEEVSRQVKAGVLNAWVATTRDGTVVGHAAIERDPPTARLGEGGAAVVDPAFRHHGISLKLGMAALEWTKEQELVALLAYTTTRHPQSQKTCVDLGGRELALLMGYIPASIRYRSIGEGDESSGVLVMYLGLGPDPDHEVHAPPQHREMLERIYEGCKLNGRFVDHGGRAEPSGPTRVDISIEASRSLARLDVTQIGSDFGEAMGLQLERLERGGITTAYVDLPLSRPETPSACDELERLGFFFAGAFPSDEASGWRLRLQYLDPEMEIKGDQVQVASDFATELRDYVLDFRSTARS
jgi:GNAT superfamily N-acetyltransferase